MKFFGEDKALAAAIDVEAEQNVMQEEEQEEKTAKAERKPYAIWTVGGETYRMKLSTAAITELETKYKTNLMNIMGTGQGGMPALKIMLDVAHTAMKQFHHGVKYADVQNMFDKYIDEGGSQLNFYTQVYMNIFTVSGFFSATLADQMSSTLEEVNEIM